MGSLSGALCLLFLLFFTVFVVVVDVDVDNDDDDDDYGGMYCCLKIQEAV